jgi:hypothetical protein
MMLCEYNSPSDGKDIEDFSKSIKLDSVSGSVSFSRRITYV